MFWNKPLLKWEYPQFAEKYVAKQLRFIDYLKAFGKFAAKLAIGSYVVLWSLQWLFSRRPAPPIFDVNLLGVVLIIVALFFLVWLVTFIGSRISKPQISLGNKGITYISVEGSAFFPYKQMESFSLIKANLEENEFFVLKIKGWDGSENFIEIDPKINNESVIEILKSKNVQMRVPLLNPS